jgi:membrane-associated protease RseP (regulator of RpoE activity)
LSAPLFFVLFPQASPLGELAPLSLYLCLLNLLPIRSFDGGRALVCFLCDRRATLPDRAERILSVVSAIVLLLLWTVAVYLLLRRGSALSLYLFCLQLFRCTLAEAGTAPPFIS